MTPATTRRSQNQKAKGIAGNGAVRRRQMSSSQLEPGLKFEEKLWAAADKLRGSVDPGEYKHVVLGLIFLKYVSDHFDEFRAQLAADQEADVDDRDEYAAENVFWVPK